MWVNTNFLISRSVQRYYSVVPDLQSIADKMVADVFAVVDEHGMREYFDPKTRAPYGATNFSWTAALYLDLKQI